LNQKYQEDQEGTNKVIMTMVSHGNDLQAEEYDEAEEQRRRSLADVSVEDPQREEKNMSASN